MCVLSQPWQLHTTFTPCAVQWFTGCFTALRSVGVACSGSAQGVAPSASSAGGPHVLAHTCGRGSSRATFPDFAPRGGARAELPRTRISCRAWWYVKSVTLCAVQQFTGCFTALRSVGVACSGCAPEHCTFGQLCWWPTCPCPWCKPGRELCTCNLSGLCTAGGARAEQPRISHTSRLLCLHASQLVA
jgi:hypothetical protein